MSSTAINDFIEALSVTLADRFKDETNTQRDISWFDDESNIGPVIEGLEIISKLMPNIELSDNKKMELRQKVIIKAKAKVERGGGENIHIGRFETWLTEKKQKKIGWENGEINTYRDRYFEYLKKYKSRSNETLSKSKKSSLRCIQKIGNPRGNSSFNSRGLVIGPVQGGKTEHFNGVIASAFDAGYHLVIVLSGIMEDLRRQTQQRIINDVIGSYDGGNPTGAELVKKFGVLGKLNEHTVRVLTSSENDFNANVASGEINLSSSKTLLVCKKNYGILQQILVYLEKQAGQRNHEIPMLIIDDEADNATLNNLSDKGKAITPGYEGPTLASKINARVRAILYIFSRNAYIGYTASPFANILQNRETEALIEPVAFEHKNKSYKFEIGDALFPRDFIELITPPPNYIGLKQLFDTKEELNKLDPMFEFIWDDLESFPKFVDKETMVPLKTRVKGARSTKKYDPFPEKLPKSLIDAIFCFILSVAIRKTRTKSLRETPFYQPHNTMLIHISRFIPWQNKTKILIEKEIKSISSKISEENPSQPNGIYQTLQKYFNTYFANSLTVGINEYLPQDYNDDFMSVVTFEEIKPLLTKTIDEIECVALNSDTGESLMYKKESPKTYLAVGGNRLSRGFTLEGLSVCYFVRDANYADTLLQMARWFGYRMGYLDCCKLFTTNDTIKKFNSISTTVESLEETIIDLSQRQPDTVTPQNYALKVETNPNVIKLTRPSILRNTKMRKVDFEDHLEQTTNFSLNSLNIEKAYQSVSSLIKKQSKNFRKESSTMMVYRKVDSDFVLKLIDCKRTFYNTNLKEIGNFISECNKNGNLTDWTVAIKITGDGAKVESSDFGFKDIRINSVVRRITGKEGGTYHKSAIADLLSDDPTFRAGGRNANIISSSDLKIATENQNLIDKAENQWKKDNNGKSIPEKVYRHLMSPKQGVLILYLIDSHGIFKKKNGKVIEELETLHKEFTTTKPLIGLVIGIPKIANSPTVDYAEDKDIGLYVNGDAGENEDPDIDIEELHGIL